jgi:hypothetical protein
LTSSVMSLPNGGSSTLALPSPSPSVLWVPDHVSSAGREAYDLARSCGLTLDPWQRWVLDRILIEDAAGAWQAFEAAMLVARQNGKGAILEARELAALFLFGDRLVLHSAHEYKTASEAFLRLQALVDGTDWIRRRVKTIRTSHGEEGIELHGPDPRRVTGRQRIRFVARSTGSGRGFTGDTIILDEAQKLPESHVEASMPAVSARPNPQIIYAATAPDRDTDPCEHLARLRSRGLAGNDADLVYVEWSAELCNDDCKPDRAACDHDDPAAEPTWAKANPGLGIRIAAAHVAKERKTMRPEGFARERLSVGRWPLPDQGWGVIAEEEWARCFDAASQIAGTFAIAAEVSPDRTWGSVAVAGLTASGRMHVELIAHKPKTDWIVPYLRTRVRKYGIRAGGLCAVVLAPGGPAGSLIPELEAAEIELAKPNARELAQAAEGFRDAAVGAALRQIGQPELTASVAAAEKRKLGDAWAFSRLQGGLAGPLNAAAEAMWGYATRAHLVEEDYDVLDSVG